MMHKFLPEFEAQAAPQGMADGWSGVPIDVRNQARELRVVCCKVSVALTEGLKGAFSGPNPVGVNERSFQKLYRLWYLLG